MDQTAPPIEFLILFCLAFMAVLALISCFSKKAHAEDQAKREKFFRDEQQLLMIKIIGSPNTTVLAGVEDEVDDFVERFQGRVDRMLYRDLVGELHAAAFNHRQALGQHPQRSCIPVKGKKMSFPFWL